MEPNEIVPFYGPFFPDIGAMALGLNLIGATPYFLKLAISKEALEEETRDSKIAVVYDGMWSNVQNEFSKDKFKKVVVATATDSMPSPKKEIVSFISYLQSKKQHTLVPKESKYICVDEAKKIANYYTGEVRVPFESNRNSFITSSSGTTIGGVTKGIVATNESIIAQLCIEDSTVPGYIPGQTCLTNFPPTASTSLNCLFLLPLYRGLTMLMDPRVSEKDFYNQMLTLRPNITFTTGSMWETFFNRIARDLKQGEKIDLSFAEAFVVGGEGIDQKKFDSWKRILQESHTKNVLYSGYGSSEFFAVVSGNTEPSLSNINSSRKVLGVGIPYVGINVKVVDEDGQELTYNKRGELLVKSNSRMKEYYKKPELTEKLFVGEWTKTGDVASIDEDGFMNIWGRKNDKISYGIGKELYLFDVANKIKESSFINDAIVINMPTNENKNSLVAHIVWDETIQDNEKQDYLIQLNQIVEDYLPCEVDMVGYSSHDTMLPYSSTTLKKDRNSLSDQLNNYIQINNDAINKIKFIATENKLYDTIMEDSKSLTKKLY